jgi:hypothetical protein
VGQFETADYADGIDAAMAALDVAFIGPVDLSVDLGTPGEPDSERMRTATVAIEAAAAAHGTPLGIFAGSPEAAADALARGYRYIVTGSDLAMLATGARGTRLSSSPPNRGPRGVPASRRPRSRPRGRDRRVRSCWCPRDFASSTGPHSDQPASGGPSRHGPVARGMCHRQRGERTRGANTMAATRSVPQGGHFIGPKAAAEPRSILRELMAQLEAATTVLRTAESLLGELEQDRGD